MKYIHASNQEYYLLIIPVVGLLVLLFNAHRMGKFRDLSVGDRLKGVVLMILVVGAAVCLLQERVLDSYLVPLDRLAAYPELEEAYQTREDGVAGENIIVVEVGNLFQSHEVYLVPCYDTVIRDVPQNGQTDWNTEIWILGEESEAISIRDLELNLEFGEETMLSSRVELNGGESLHDMGTERTVRLGEEMDLSDGERFRIRFTAGTSPKAERENQETQGSFVWNYDLYYDGTKVAEIRDDRILGTYLINAA